MGHRTLLPMPLARNYTEEMYFSTYFFPPLQLFGSIQFSNREADCSDRTVRPVNYTCDNWKELSAEPSIRRVASLVIGRWQQALLYCCIKRLQDHHAFLF
ncbi:hypothetical protein VULLAG_LOCUS23315 [Vulpes lagopus]